MFTCPMCKKTLPDLPRQCSACRSDLSLLTDFTDHVRTGLERAEQHTRAGRLGSAIWEYLYVLESDPDNPLARAQVGQVVTAVRQFDRRRRGERFHHWLEAALGGRHSLRWLTLVLWSLMMLASVGVGFWGGYILGQQRAAAISDTRR